MDILLSLLKQTPRPDWEWKLTTQSGWSRENASSLANFALLAYNDLPVIEEHLSARGFSKVIPLQSDIAGIDTQAFLAVRSDAVVVAFRGTEPANPVDFFTDFTTARVSFEDKFHQPGWGHVWQGWADGVLAVWPKLAETLKTYDDAQRSLWITGHSLGGALAIVMAAIVANLSDHPIQGVYTYGQPRVGDPEFCRRYTQLVGDRTFRVVNDHDLVPHVPPRRFTRLEQHVFNVDKPWSRIRDLPDALRNRAEVYEYDHIGQLRLLLPQGGVTDDEAKEVEREPAFLREERTFPGAALNLAQLSLETFARIKDHAPINPVTHDGYIERLLALS